MKFEEHCEDCVRFLGQPFEEVHLWLDELFASRGVHHRKFRHHRDGIEEVRKLFGDAAMLAAYRHIVADLRMDGMWCEELGIPKNEEQYKAWGLY